MRSSDAGAGSGLAGSAGVPASWRIALVVSILLPALTALALLAWLTRPGGAPAPVQDQERATAEAIQKVGAVTLQAGNREPRSGEQVFLAQCSACHGNGALGSPRFRDAAAWAPRIRGGFAQLLNSALRGKNAMPAQGAGMLSDLEVARGVVYMANAGGASFSEPGPAGPPLAK